MTDNGADRARAAAATPEGIEPQRVTAWFVDNVPGVQPPLRFSLITGGHSNLTFRVDDAAGGAFVLRRPPLGHVLESAHDMGREHRIISALAGSAVPVAPALGLCSEADVNGAPFYVMAFVAGEVLDTSAKAAALPEAVRHGIGEHVIRILADLHAIDPDDVGLGDLGRKEEYLARQLRRWTRQWEASKTHDVPSMEAASALLHERVPAQVGATIVHGDFRLGNMLARGGRIAGVLDWELCTLGDPLADVGYLLNDWVLPGELPEDTVDDRSPTAAGGFPDRDALCRAYGDATGRDLVGIDYYRAFSHWRLAAIAQGVYKRYLVGAMGENRDMDLERYKTSITTRADAALALLEGADA